MRRAWLRRAIRNAYAWSVLAAAAGGAVACGTASSSTTPTAPASSAAGTSTSITSSTTSADSAAGTSATTTLARTATTPTTESATTSTSATASTTPTTTNPVPGQTTTQAQVSPTLQSCGSLDFGPSSSYLASGITAVGTDCATARIVAAASRSHQFDPPRANAPVQDFSALGFGCVGQQNSAVMLAVVEYRCTRGSAAVTFARS